MEAKAPTTESGNSGPPESLARLQPAEEWMSPGRYAGFLALLVFVMFPGVFLGRETFALRDFGMFSYPVAHFHQESFWRGELPLWNPYNFCGIPFLAQWNTMTLYPGSLIYLLFPLTWSLPFFCLVHLFWGGLGMYFLACRWTGNRLAGALAGVIFSFNGLMLNFLMWPSHVATFAWMPWVLWLVPEGWRTGGRKLVWGVIAGSMQMLAGGPETIVFTWGILLLLAFGEWLQSTRAAGTPAESAKVDETPASEVYKVNRRGCVCSWTRNPIPARFLGIVLLVALVCAAQLLPFLQLLANSERDAKTASAGFDWPMPAWGWANFLVPMFRTVPSSQGVFFQLPQNWTSSYYTGVLTIFLAGIALWRVRSWQVRMLGLLAGASLLLAFGDSSWLYRGLQSCIPLVGAARYPVKFAILIVGVLPLLAALGLRWLLLDRKGMKRAEWLWATGVLVLVAAIIIFDRRQPIPEDMWHLTWKNGLMRAAFFVALLAVTLLLLKWSGRPRKLCAGLLLIVCWYDLSTHVPNQNPTVPPKVYSAGWAEAQLARDKPPRLGEARIMLAPEADSALRYHTLPSLAQDHLVKRLAFFANCNLLDGVPQTYGLFSLAPAEVSNLANLPYFYTNAPVQRLLDFMGVSRTTAPGSLNTWTNRPTAMPLVTAGQKPVFADDSTVVATLLQTNIDLRRVVLLPPTAKASLLATNKGAARVLETRFSRQRIEAEVDATTPSMVVISQSYYPAWKAYVDGAPTPILRANYAFQAVEVAEGRHEIVLCYQDNLFRIGVLMSGLGLLGCLGLWWFQV